MTRLILLTLLSVGMLSAQTTMSVDSFKKYEEGKKDKAVAFAISTVIPGGGMMYADNDIGGIAVFGATVGAGFWLRSAVKNDEEVVFPLLAMAVLRVIDIVLAFDGVDEYNRALRNHVTVAVGAGSIGLRFHL